MRLAARVEDIPLLPAPLGAIRDPAPERGGGMRLLGVRDANG